MERFERGDKVKYGMKTYTVAEVLHRKINSSKSDSLLIGPSAAGRAFIVLSHECEKIEGKN